MQLFTYGTLMFPAVWRRVAEGEFARQSATLAGYSVYRVRGDVYPVLVASDQSAIAPGVVYFDIDQPTLAKLDRYETDLYVRQTVRAVVADGRELDCQAYVLPPGRWDLASPTHWTAEWFEAHALETYLARLG